MASANFSDLLKAAEDAGFSLCPVGDHDVKIVSAEAKKSAAGKDMILIKYEVTSGPHAGRKVLNNIVISPENANALGFFFRNMRAMGLDSAYFAANPTVQKVAADLAGKLCRITVGRREWNGEEREDVKKIMPPATGTGGIPAPVAAAPAPPQPVTNVTAVKVAADPNAPHLPY